MKRIILLLLTLLACWVLPAHAADNQWLVGKWELAHDPDGGEKDWMEFTADGKVYSISAQGVRVPGKYTVKGVEIRALFEFQGKTIPMLLNYTNDKKKLLYYSQRSRNTAEYTKVK